MACDAGHRASPARDRIALCRSARALNADRQADPLIVRNPISCRPARDQRTEALGHRRMENCEAALSAADRNRDEPILPSPFTCSRLNAGARPTVLPIRMARGLGQNAFLPPVGWVAQAF